MSMGPLDLHGQLLKSSSPSCEGNPPRFCGICSCPLVDGESQRVESPQIVDRASSVVRLFDAVSIPDTG